MSLQPIKKSQVVVPDDQGIMRSHQVRADTARYIQTIVEAEKRMDSATQAMNIQSQVPPIPSPSQSTSSVGSAPSASSLTSGASSIFPPTQTTEAHR